MIRFLFIHRVYILKMIMPYHATYLLKQNNLELYYCQHLELLELCVQCLIFQDFVSIFSTASVSVFRTSNCIKTCTVMEFKESNQSCGSGYFGWIRIFQKETGFRFVSSGSYPDPIFIQDRTRILLVSSQICNSELKL